MSLCVHLDRLIDTRGGPELQEGGMRLMPLAFSIRALEGGCKRGFAMCYDEEASQRVDSSPCHNN
jgi:hypothetical protein